MSQPATSEILRNSTKNMFIYAVLFKQPKIPLISILITVGADKGTLEMRLAKLTTKCLKLQVNVINTDDLRAVSLSRANF